MPTRDVQSENPAISSHRSISEYLVALGSLCPFLLVVWFQLRTAANVPWSDEWNFLLPFVDHYLHTATLTWADLWAPYETHRYVLPKLIFLVSAHFDHLNFRHLKILNAGILMLASLVLLRQLLRLVQGRDVMWLIPPMCLFFSLRQWESLGDALHVANFLVLFWSLLAIAHLEASIRAKSRRRHTTHLFLSLAAGVLSSMSAGNGILIWPALILLAAFGKRRRDLATVGAAACSVLLVYYRGIDGHSFLPWIFRHPLLVAIYIFQNLGACLVAEDASAVLLPLGIVLAVSYGVAVWGFWGACQDERADARPFLAYFLFAFANTASFVGGRLAAGIFQPDASRYMTLTVLAPVGALMVLHICRETRRTNAVAKSVLGCLMIVGTLYADATMVKIAPFEWKYEENLYRLVSQDTPRTPAEYQPFLGQSQESIERGITILREHRLGPFCCETRATHGITLFVSPERVRPSISRLWPESTIAGRPINLQPDGSSALSVDGLNFRMGAVVYFDGIPLTTAWGGRTTVSATIPQAMLAMPRRVRIEVRNPDNQVSGAAVLTLK